MTAVRQLVKWFNQIKNAKVVCLKKLLRHFLFNNFKNWKKIKSNECNKHASWGLLWALYSKEMGG